jgi:galactokinase
MIEFQQPVGRPAAHQAQAAGRVNLIGEHTDYNGGFVLPTLIPQQTRIQIWARDDDTVRVASLGISPAPAEYKLGEEKQRHDWLDYVQGVTHVLRAAGYAIRGFDAIIESDVPVGSGLSSSAALDVCLMRAIRNAFDLELYDIQIAQLGQRVENEFVGALVGIMDPMVCSLGREGFALFIDAWSLDHELVPLPSEADLVVINSGVAHQHSAGDYNTRRAECEQAAAQLGVEKLRDLAESDLAQAMKLTEPLNRRARHVVTENTRVQAAVGALRDGDLARLGQLFNASHDSQRDDYDVSIPEIDLLVDLARQDARVYGARLTGGGFGGSIVLLAHVGTGRAVAEKVVAEYAQRSGNQATILVPPSQSMEGR